MSNRTVIRTVITPRAITRRVGPAGAGGGTSTFAGLTDKATADLPAINTPLASALSGKQPLDADLTSWAGVTRAAGFDPFTATPSSANLRSLVTDETGSGALVFGTLPAFAGFSATGAVTFSTGTTFTYGTGIAAAHRTALGLDQELSALLPRLSRITVSGTTPAFPDPLVEQPYLSNGKREWRGLSGSYLLFDSGVWNLYHFDGVDDYSAYSISTTTNEPWTIPSGDWIIDRGTGAPVLTIDPPVLLPVSGASGTIALSTDQQGRVAPADMTGLGTGVATALGLAANAANGFPTANGAGRTALGSGATGDALFTAASASAARTTLGFDTAVPKIPITFSNSSDFSTASTSFVGVTGLSFPVLANKSYSIYAFLLTNKNDANGLAVQFTGPASPAKLFFRIFSSTTSISGGAVNDFITAFSSPTSAINTVNGDGFLSLNQALFTNGANAGTVQLQLRAVTGGTAKIYAGSYLVVTEL
jgi:hypothetical protein